MRARVGARLRRLDKLEARALNDDGAVRGGVMLVPKVMGLDEWEAIAVPMQAALAQAAREDIDRHAPPEPYRDPIPGALTPRVEGVDFHYPDPNRSQEPVPLKKPPLPPRRPTTCR